MLGTILFYPSHGPHQARPAGTRLYLGNMNAKRDWGQAKDYVEMQRLMLQQEIPEDFVIATGEQYSVGDFVDTAEMDIGMVIHGHGKCAEEKGYDSASRYNVAVEPGNYRPTEVETLLGDHPAKPNHVLQAAAKVGGIQANNAYRGEFIYANLLNQTIVIHQSYLHKVDRPLFPNSSCIFPELYPQPIREEYL